MLTNKIRDLRKKRNWSQQELAEKAGLSFSAIVKLDTGLAKHPTIQTIAKLAEAFGISIDELMERKTN